MTTNTILTKECALGGEFSGPANYLGLLPNPDSILRRTGKTIAAYRELKNDPHVWACIQSRKSGVASLEYSIPANGANAEALDFTERAIAGLDLIRLERDILEAPLFGYQPLEIMWKCVSANGRTMLAPSAVVAKPQEWFAFAPGGSPVYKQPGRIDSEELPKYKFLFAQYEPDYLNPYGQSLLAKCYWHVVFKKGGLRFWVNFTERYGMPLLLGSYTRGSSREEAEKLVEELAKMTEDTVIVAPHDVSVELKEASRSSSVSSYSDLIKYCNSEISKAILSQTLTTEIDMGSYAAAATHFKVRREVILSDARLVESVINKLIEYVVELNFPGSCSPRFSLVLNDAENADALARDLKMAQNSGFKLSKSYWMENYGFKSEDFEE